MPQKLVNCTSDVKKQLSGKYPSWSSQKVDRTARAICVKSTGLTFKKDSQFALPDSFFTFLESHGMNYNEDGDISVFQLEYTAPAPEIGEIIEQANAAGEMQKYRVARGLAIYPVKSRNNRRYLKSEIEKASKTLVGVPLQKDHSESVNDTYGTIVKQEFNPSSGHQRYEALLDPEDPITKKIEAGFIKNVSVSINPKTMECNICGERMNYWHKHIPGFEYDGKEAEAVPKDWYYRHLGTVTVPGVPKASIKTSGESASESDYEFDFVDSANEMILEMITEAYEPFYEAVVQKSNGFVHKHKDKGVIMTDEIEEQYKELAKNYEKQGLIIEQLQKQLDAQDAEHKKFVEGLQKQKHSELVEKVTELELNTNRLKKENVSSRRDELSKMNQIQLETRYETLKEFEAENASNTKKVTPRSVSFNEMQSPDGRSPPHQMEAGEMSERAKYEYDIGMLGSVMFPSTWNPTNKALQTLERWDFNRNDWKDFKGVLGEKAFTLFK